eukprot:760719-Rhodomonas_salina.2
MCETQTACGEQGAAQGARSSASHWQAAALPARRRAALAPAALVRPRAARAGPTSQLQLEAGRLQKHSEFHGGCSPQGLGLKREFARQ